MVPGPDAAAREAAFHELQTSDLEQHPRVRCVGARAAFACNSLPATLERDVIRHCRSFYWSKQQANVFAGNETPLILQRRWMWPLWT